ncbi:hypothetical protein AMECASPLE_017672 [Ameca splendens]|uniref:Uncharacterized protein n=1 Tax=Ameca splendens TaxID=208324 RepID=A0ABV0YDT7_9TELE
MHTALWPLQHLSFFLMCSPSLLHAVSPPFTVILTLYTFAFSNSLFLYISLLFCRDASWHHTQKQACTHSNHFHTSTDNWVHVSPYNEIYLQFSIFILFDCVIKLVHI